MPGTLAHDALASVLVNATLTANNTGTGQEVNRPGRARVKLSVGTVTGTSPTLDVEVQASDKSDFSSGVVKLGKFAQVTSSTQTRYLLVDVQHRYVRTVATVGGTSPSFGTTKVTLEEKAYLRTKTDTA